VLGLSFLSNLARAAAPACLASLDSATLGAGAAGLPDDEEDEELCVELVSPSLWPGPDIPSLNLASFFFFLKNLPSLSLILSLSLLPDILVYILGVCSAGSFSWETLFFSSKIDLDVAAKMW